MISLRRALIALALAGFVLGLLVLTAILTSDHTENKAAVAALDLLVGWSFIGTGLYAWDRRPSSRVGPFMKAVGLTWLLAGFMNASVPGLFIAGAMISALPIAILVHMTLTFPSGRLDDKCAKAVVIGAYVLAVLLAPVPYLFADTTVSHFCGPDCPTNPLMIWNEREVADAMFAGFNGIGAALLVATLVLAVRRWRRATPEARRDLGPTLWAAFVTIAFFATVISLQFTGLEEEIHAVYLLAVVPLASIPYAFLGGLLRSRLVEADEIAAENARLDAELKRRYEELRASRARIVEAADAARRKLERDLHDGAQQRLVGLALSLRMARERIDSDPGEARALLDEAQAELARATEELRELARGIHPAVLTDRGLSAALAALAKRSPLRVELKDGVGERLPDSVEAAAYFVVAEALTNAARHAGTDRAEVEVARRDGHLRVAVRDEGRGGADPSGSGLRGLADRVQALDGELEISSPPGKGTRIVARIPVG
jgi:signal transduction histidine kinase